MRFAIYDVTNGEKKSAVRVEEDGSVLLLVKGPGGAVLNSVEMNIAPDRAAAIVAGVTANFHELRSSAGRYSLGRGEGMGVPEITSFDQRDLPASLIGSVSSLRELLSEVNKQSGGEDLDAEVYPVDRDGPINNVEIGLWGAVLMVAHLSTALIVVFALIAALPSLVQSFDANPMTALIGSLLGAVVVTFLCIGLLYFIAGYLVGRMTQNDPERTAFWVGVVALGIPAIATLLMGSIPSLVSLALLPWVAGLGGRLSARGREPSDVSAEVSSS